MVKTNSIFSSVTEAVEATNIAFNIYKKLGVSNREEIVKQIRNVLNKNINIIAEMTFRETQMGKLDDKKEKLRIVINRTPGTEDLVTEVLTKDRSMTLYELSAYGVVCAILPSTNPSATLINNVISLLSAGNAVILCPHPRAIKVSKYLTKLISDTIYEISGIENLVVTLDNISMKNIHEVMNHPDVDLLLSTGGSDVARETLKCHKKIIAAGPANPTFIVDETADIEKAASCITKGASFDNNLMCITEKNIILVKEVYQEFINELEKDNVYNIDNLEDMLKLSKLVLTDEMKPNKLFGGKDANYILDMAGINRTRDYKLIAVDVPKIHPFVTEELLMPIITIVTVENFSQALDVAVTIEQRLKHTAGIHSNSIERLNIAARELKTSLFVKNGCSLDVIGFSDNNPVSFSIANITGEGAITARNLARRRRCVLVDAFSIR